MNLTVGAIVARFQVPELTEGHVALIDHVRKLHGRVMVLMGCSPTLGSKRNPLDFPVRQKMLQDKYPDLIVLPIHDMGDDYKWSNQLDGIVRGICPMGTVTLYGGRDSFIPHYKGNSKTVELELGFSPSGTDVRNVTANRIRISSDFRAGIIYAYSNVYGRVFSTVDIGCVQDGQLLLGRKANSDFWCLPGGFVDQADLSKEQTAARELREETGLVTSVHDLKYLCSSHVKDWRYSDPENDGIIMTTLYITQKFSSKAVAGDDLQEVRWFTLIDLVKDTFNQVAPAHVDLVSKIAKHIGFVVPKGEFV